MINALEGGIKMDSKEKIKKISELPYVNCPSCSNGTCFPAEIIMACEKCASIYPIDTDIFKDYINLSLADKREIRKHINSIYKRKEEMEKLQSIIKDNIVTNEDSLNGISIIYQGTVLSTLRKLKKEYGFSNIMATVRFITEGFLFLLSEMRKLSGNKIYLIDSDGNRSKDIKEGAFKSTIKAFNEEQDRAIVDRFIDDINIMFKATSIKERNSN